jgi:hypothetical protein
MTEPTRRGDRQGWALRRLLEIHDGLRSDLARLRRAVAAVSEDGQDVDAATAALGALSFRQPGWTLRRFCAGFCASVHGHHATEDTVLFPILLRRQGADGALGVVVVVLARANGDRGHVVTRLGLRGSASRRRPRPRPRQAGRSVLSTRSWAFLAREAKQRPLTAPGSLVRILLAAWSSPLLPIGRWCRPVAGCWTGSPACWLGP